VEGEASGIEAVQKDLAAGECLVEFSGAGGSVVAFVVARGFFRALEIPGRREIEAQARKFADGLCADAGLAAGLGARLMAPILEAVDEALRSGGAGDGAGTLVVVPFGELHRIPFEALSVQGRWLIERCAVAYLPSASVLRYIEKGAAKAGRPGRLVAFADPDTDYSGSGKPSLPALRGARLEVEAIAPLFPEASVLTGRDATKGACLKLAPGSEVVHLACHGEFFPARPLDSRLYLSRDGSADGLLRTSEIYGVDFRGSRLVTLSGCETGRSGVGASEDPVGIGTAFLHAGAGALLVSLWKVDDQATSELMKTFYRKWIEDGGSSRARSLREAKLAFLKTRPQAPPRLWAAFVLVGPR